MIKNERQYRLTRVQADKFEATLRELDESRETPAGKLSTLRIAEREAMCSQIESLRGELAEYEALRSGQIRSFSLDSFDALPSALIRARIARGWSQRELAEQLGIKEQQIQRYEATEYASASLSRLRKIIETLRLTVHEQILLSEK